MVDNVVVGQAVCGDPRADVYKVYPTFNNKNSGFHYGLGTSKLSEGEHTVSIKEESMSGKVNQLVNRKIVVTR